MARSKEADHPATRGIWKWEVARNKTYGDANLAEFFNVSPQQCLCGVGIEAYLAAIVEDDRERVVNAIQQSVKTRSILLQHYRVKTASRGIRTILVTGRCFADEVGNPSVHLGWFVDVTGRIELEALSNPERRGKLAQDLDHCGNRHLVGYLLGNVLEEIERAFSADGTPALLSRGRSSGQ